MACLRDSFPATLGNWCCFPDSLGSCSLFNQMISLTDAVNHFILSRGPTNVWFYIHNRSYASCSTNSLKHISTRMIIRFNFVQEFLIYWMKTREVEGALWICAWTQNSEACCSISSIQDVPPSSWALFAMNLCAKLEKTRNEFYFEILATTVSWMLFGGVSKVSFWDHESRK